MEIRLPEEEGVDVTVLSGLFRNMNQSYKLFWFKAIVEKVKDGVFVLSYDELANCMIADAWYMVLEYRLSLGAGNTRLEEVVRRAGEISGLKSSEKPEEILKFLQETRDKEIIDGKKDLVENVPYRLLRPFMNGADKAIWNKGEKRLAQAINECKAQRLIYYFVEMNSLYTRIEVQPIWISYIRKNSAIILGWIYFEMIKYLQKRNPNIPGIPNKLYPPQQRKNISKAQKYWKAVVEEARLEGNPIRDIYGNIPLRSDEVVIDHFIPWSYLAHDELWNLNPTIQSINSSKGNYLADWDRYIRNLCEQEYQAYRIANRNEKILRIFEECKKVHINDEKIREGLYHSKRTKEEFCSELEGILFPVYESAKKAGFSDGWIWRG